MAVSRETEKKFGAYLDLLHKWQAKINLVSSETLKDARRRHIDDSAQLEDLLPANAKTVFDLGSGAGFPGLVLAMMRDDLDVHLIESDSKKCAFLSTVSRETKTDVSIHNERVEKLATEKIVPDIITARAFAPLPEILRYCLPWAGKNPNLKLIFLKGEKAHAEVEEAQKKYRFETIFHPSKTAQDSVILEISSLCIK